MILRPLPTFKDLLFCLCISVRVYVNTGVLRDQKRAPDSFPGTGVIGGSEGPRECWALNLGPLQE